MADFEVSGTATIDAERLIASIDDVLIKLDEFEEKIEDIDDKLDRLSRKSVDISVNIDGEDKLDELKLFLDDIDSHDFDAKVRVDVVDQDKLDKLYLEILELELHDHDVKIKIDTTGLAESEAKLELFNRQLDDLDNKEKKVQKSTDDFHFSLAMLAPLLIPLSSMVLSVAGGIGGLASAFGTMLPPVALAAYGVGKLYQSISTLYTGLNANTQAALMNATTYGQMYSILDKNSKAFHNMSSLMQEGIIGFVTLKQVVSQFEDAIQTNGLLVLINGFKLLTTSLSMMIDPANEAAGAIARLLEDFTNRLSDPTFQTFFDNMDKNIGTLVTDWGGGVENIIEGIVAMLNAFMPLSLSMSGGFLNMTQSFDTWAQHLASDPGFKRFVQEVETNGPKILDVIGKVVALIWRLIAALGESGVNVGIFDTLSKALGKLNDVASTHPALAQLFADLSLIGIAAWKLGPALAPLLAFIATPVGAAVAVILALGGAFVYAYEKSASFRQWVATNLGPLWKQLTGDVQQFVTFMKGIWPQIQEIWQKYGGNIIKIVLSQWQFIVSIIGGALKIIEGIILIFAGVLNGNWSEIGKGIEKIVSGLWQIVVGLFKAALTQLVNISEMIWKLVSKLTEAAWNGIVNNFKTNLRDIGNAISTAWNNAVSNTLKWGTNMVNAVKTGIASVLTWFTSLPGKIVSALGNVGSLLYNAGASLIKGFISGMGSQLGSVESWLGNLTNDLTSWKGPPEKDAKLLSSSGQLIIQGLIDGMESKYGAVRNSLSGLTNTMGNSMSKQLTTSLTARINSSLNSASGGVPGAMGIGAGAGALGGSGQSQVTFAAGSIVVNNPVAEQPGITLTRTMQGISKFGTIQSPAGLQTR